jgi:hypothetical protein
MADDANGYVQIAAAAASAPWLALTREPAGGLVLSARWNIDRELFGSLGLTAASAIRAGFLDFFAGALAGSASLAQREQALGVFQIALAAAGSALS